MGVVRREEEENGVIGGKGRDGGKGGGERERTGEIERNQRKMGERIDGKGK